jgi:hypothetical protein
MAVPQIGAVQRLEKELLNLLHVPVSLVISAYVTLPLPAAGAGYLVLAPDEVLLDVTFYNNGTGNVYFYYVQNVQTGNSFVIPPQAAYNPPFPPTNPVWAAGDAGHDLRVARLIVASSARRSNVQF